MKTLFVIVWKESGEILDPKSFKKYWPNYGSKRPHRSYGWRPTKKVYYTLGTAKSGFKYIPKEIKKELAIAEFSLDNIVMDGVELEKVQEESKLKKELKRLNKQNEKHNS